MDSERKFAYLLPHTDFEEPIEHAPLALVPPGDARLRGLPIHPQPSRALPLDSRTNSGSNRPPS